MLYRLLLNYFKIRLFQFLLSKILKSKAPASLNKLSFVDYGMKVILSFIESKKFANKK
ncbi:hypothetical protein HBNCFIEN_01161 [Legionella sp. PC997]|nr:hypothetical protein HBNCFIEN_01161 [Legionella sp. PC997]